MATPNIMFSQGDYPHRERHGGRLGGVLLGLGACSLRRQRSNPDRDALAIISGGVRLASQFPEAPPLALVSVSPVIGSHLVCDSRSAFAHPKCGILPYPIHHHTIADTDSRNSGPSQ